MSEACGDLHSPSFQTALLVAGIIYIHNRTLDDWNNATIIFIYCAAVVSMFITMFVAPKRRSKWRRMRRRERMEREREKTSM